MAIPKLSYRRRAMIAGGCALAGGIGVARYLTMRPAPPEGAPMTVTISDLSPGKLRSLDWEGRLVWILRRTPEEVAALADREAELADPESVESLQPAACRNRHRSVRPEIFVALGQCTHQGCPPQLRALGAHGEFLCPCHTSRFDLAGRVFKAGPAPSNLVVPLHRYDGDGRIVIGVG
jgi:ubiquinol-cytochrome c reductase iron-sulfur subunit